MKIDIIEEEELRYVAKIKDGNVNLRHSNSEIWTSHTKGSKIGKLKDTGNEIKININNKKIELNYGEFTEMLTMMNLKNYHDEQLYIEQKWVK